MTTTGRTPGWVGMLGWLVSAGLPVLGMADVAADAPQSPHTFTANAGVVSNYIFRGLTQTWDKPALQGGVDYAHADGWYAGLWGSSISSKQYADGWAELDGYGGFNGKFNEDWTWTLGVVAAYYPRANYDKSNPPGNPQSYTNVEVNAGLGYKWVSAKVSVALTDYFGANAKTGFQGDSKGTSYWDLTATVPLPEDKFSAGVTLPVHVGRTHYTTRLASTLDPDYTDYKVGINKAIDGGWSVGAAYTYASNGSVYDNFPSARDATDTRNVGGSNVVFSLTKSF